jgi:hypothetical protein
MDFSIIIKSVHVSALWVGAERIGTTCMWARAERGLSTCILPEMR